MEAKDSKIQVTKHIFDPVLFSEAYWNCPQRLQRPQVAAEYPMGENKILGGFTK